MITRVIVSIYFIDYLKSVCFSEKETKKDVDN